LAAAGNLSLATVRPAVTPSCAALLKVLVMMCAAKGVESTLEIRGA